MTTGPYEPRTAAAAGTRRFKFASAARGEHRHVTPAAAPAAPLRLVAGMTAVTRQLPPSRPGGDGLDQARDLSRRSHHQHATEARLARPAGWAVPAERRAGAGESLAGTVTVLVPDTWTAVEGWTHGPGRMTGGTSDREGLRLPA